MQSEPRWITRDEIVWINETTVAGTGEPHRLSHPDLLESAVARPRNRWQLANETDVLRLASTLLYGVVMNHAFEQGNKRTGAISALIFLEANGYEWTLEDNGELAEWVLRMVNNQLSEHDLAELMRPHVRQATSDAL